MGSQQIQAGFSMSAALASFPAMHPAVGYASSPSVASSYFGAAAALASSAAMTASSQSSSVGVGPSVVGSSEGSYGLGM
jgi:hypothetical protein